MTSSKEGWLMGQIGAETGETALQESFAALVQCCQECLDRMVEGTHEFFLQRSVVDESYVRIYSGLSYYEITNLVSRICDDDQVTVGEFMKRHGNKKMAA